MLKKKHTGIHITAQWVPGHKGVDGNKQANEQAKKAITDGSSKTCELPKSLKKDATISKLVARWAYGEKTKWNAQKLWQQSPQYTKMKKTDPTAPSSKYIDLITGILRKATSILSQLRTGHAP
jgi:hypothetical protein